MFKVLMFGWEYPPYNSGGLGVACQGLAKALALLGIKIIFVLPKKLDCRSPFFKIVFADGSLEIKTVNSLLVPYATSKSYGELSAANNGEGIYGSDLFAEVSRYGGEAGKIALSEDFNIIHAHDWLSFPAGLEAKRVSGKPLIVQVHSTEFDRTGGHNIDRRIYEIEKIGLMEADKVIAVSNLGKTNLVDSYGVNPDKIEVVHNAIESGDFSKPSFNLVWLKQAKKKVVLFVGRITLQKGPDYFLKAAKKVLEYDPEVFFIMAGSGDMERQIINEAAALDIADRVLFAGFLRDDELTAAYQLADLYVLPSVSDPFGLTVLESLACGTPVLISKQTGVGELLRHCLKADFWDTDDIADKILAVLRYKPLRQSLKENGQAESKKFTWQDSAQKCVAIYHEILNLPSIV